MRKFLQHFCTALFIAFIVQAEFLSVQAHPPVKDDRRTIAINHDEAVQLGLRRGLGTAEGAHNSQSSTLTVASFQEFQFDYIVGRTPIEAGGSIRVSMRHVFHWSLPQTEDPAGAGFTEVFSPENVKIEVVPWPKRSDSMDNFVATFPWQHSIEVRVVSGSLQPGQKITIVYGSQRLGGPGAQVQPSEESAFAFRFYVAPTEDATHLPLAEDVVFPIVGGDAEAISVLAHSNGFAGKTLNLLVRAEDKYGNRASNFFEMVKVFNESGELVWSGCFQEEAKGVFPLEILIPETTGTYRFWAESGGFTSQSNPVVVGTDQSGTGVFWGDIHGHSRNSDGRGTISDFYTYCRDVAALDFCSITDHGFQITEQGWAESKAVTEQFNDPDRFVTIQAYEWSGLTPVGGDHNIYFRGSDPPIFRSRSFYDPRNQQSHHSDSTKIDFILDLYDQLLDFGEGNVLTVPHFGGRPANPEFHEPKIERLVEVYSEHGRNPLWAAEFLRRGYKLGLIGSSDNHTGRPGYGFLINPYDSGDEQLEIGAALVAVRSKELTRESVFNALYNRSVYATTGDRIILDFKTDLTEMGGVDTNRSPPRFRVQVVGTKKIDEVQIIRDAVRIATLRVDDLVADLVWSDDGVASPQGVAVAYWIRVIQEGGEEAMSSPIWWAPN